MAAPAGSVVSIYMDTRRAIEVGDQITTRSGRRYDVRSVRVQRRGANAGRQHMMVRVMEPDEPDLGTNNHTLWWYKR